jgi:BirA family biotin operon repressor/biotin-[acetyl-CoA-carboxylase] ligase
VETLGKTVRIKSGNSVEEGLAESINPDGSLTLRRADGSLVTIVTGE